MGVSAKPPVTLIDALRKTGSATPVKRASNGSNSDGFQRLLERIRTGEATTVDRTPPSMKVSRTGRLDLRPIRAPAVQRTFGAVGTAPPSNAKPAAPEGDGSPRSSDVHRDFTQTATDSQDKIGGIRVARQSTSGAGAEAQGVAGGRTTSQSASAAGESGSDGQSVATDAGGAGTSASGAARGNSPDGEPGAAPVGNGAPLGAVAVSTDAVGGNGIAESAVAGTLGAAVGATQVASEPEVASGTTGGSGTDPGSGQQTLTSARVITVAGGADQTAVAAVGDGTSQEAAVSPSGKHFPGASGLGENISTKELLQSLERQVTGSTTSVDRPASGLFAAEEPAGGIGRELSLRDSAADLQRLGASEPALRAETAPQLDPTLLAAGRAVQSTAIGTLPAFDMAQAITARSSELAPQYAWLVGDRQPQPHGTSLEAAQTVVRRWAASEAFSRGPVATAHEVVGKAQEWDSPSRTVGEESRARASRDASAATLSFVRAQRAKSGGPTQPSGPSMFAQQVQSAEQVHAPATSGANAASGQGSAPAQAGASQGYTPLMEFVAYEARRQVRLGKREFRVQLNPEHLGTVELEVVLEGNELIVRMKAASETAQQVLEENIEQLARSLAEQGMTLDVEIPWSADKQDKALSPSVAGWPGL